MGVSGSAASVRREDEFCERVAEEAKPIRPDCAVVAFLK
jgi:hypothetical protein